MLLELAMLDEGQQYMVHLIHLLATSKNLVIYK
jgi:hypothetical protein